MPVVSPTPEVVEEEDKSLLEGGDDLATQAWLKRIKAMGAACVARSKAHCARLEAEKAARPLTWQQHQQQKRQQQHS
ncbi:hypothetical protein FOA52_013569 [Chlamydomonas sp. UWO 241]|nr:hypothetical protein FOA52_013569 [Chlamydomonas sp. UWO 241]